MAQGNDVVTLVGTKRRKYLAENLRAVDVELTEADLARIDELVPRESVAGLRYPAEHMAAVAGR